MNRSNEIDIWRRNLQEVEGELEEKTKELNDSQAFFCSAINRLARIVNSETSHIQPQLDDIKKASANPKKTVVLKNAVEALTTKIMQMEPVEFVAPTGASSHGAELYALMKKMSDVEGNIPQILEMRRRVSRISSTSELSSALEDIAVIWKQSINQPVGNGKDSSQFCAILISEILYQLLENISFPHEIAGRLNELKQTLDAGVPVNQWEGLLDQMSDLAVDVQKKINQERVDIEDFLRQVTSRLQDLDRYILGTQKEHDKAWKHGKALGDAVKSEIQHLFSNANETQDVDVLKQQIQTRLATIENHVNGFHLTEKSQSTVANEDVKRLIARLHELEAESETLKTRVKKERMQAQTDALTGIPNRLGYDSRIMQEHARWKRFATPLCLVVWDVDLFKRINDEFGHASGDKALKAIAKLLINKIRETDYLARYGGEEFVLIMPGANLSAAKIVAEKLREVIAQSGFHFNGKPVSITVSGGIAEFTPGDTTGSVFERADKALYRAKSAGRNCVLGMEIK